MEDVLQGLAELADELDARGDVALANKATEMMVRVASEVEARRRKKPHEDSHDGKGIPMDPHGQPGYDSGEGSSSGGAAGGGGAGGAGASVERRRIKVSEEQRQLERAASSAKDALENYYLGKYNIHGMGLAERDGVPLIRVFSSSELPRDLKSTMSRTVSPIKVAFIENDSAPVTHVAQRNHEIELENFLEAEGIELG